MHKTIWVRFLYFRTDNLKSATCGEPRQTIGNLKSVGLSIIVFVLVVAGAAQAQQPSKIPRLGYLSYGSVEIDRSLVAALRHGLRELGYLEGKNIIIEQRYAKGQSDKLPELIAEFLRIQVDVLVVAGDPAMHAAKKANSTSLSS
jgi:putative ABC transport system substrate-binding protein